MGRGRCEWLELIASRKNIILAVSVRYKTIETIVLGETCKLADC